MKKKKDTSFLSNLKHKFRLIVMSDYSLQERISFRFTGVQLIAFFTVTAVLLFVFFLLLVGYTPLSEYVPGKASSRLHKELIGITLKTDSLEIALLENELYLKNISAIINGEDPLNLIEEMEKSTEIAEGGLSFKRSKEDSLLRVQVEAEDKISLSAAEDNKNEDLESILFFSPLKGVVTQKFDREKDHFGTDVVAKENEPIKCVFDGVVVISHWTFETGYVIGVQHANGIFSLYKHNSTLFKYVGQHVSSGEAIAIIGNSGEFSSGPHLHFELWYNGIPINPENYISF
tara:strand:+ start:6744 stop:7610 length:867 start_codon:yes stop_codon:yes gene_type:complete